MSEWWTYSLSDFLLFSPRTYYRLFELYNLAVWPWHVLAIVLGLAVLVLWLRRGAWQGRSVAVILAACWLFVAWAYLLARYDTITGPPAISPRDLQSRRCCWSGPASSATGYRHARARTWPVRPG
jgi:hypothetical protein